MKRKKITVTIDGVAKVVNLSEKLREAVETAHANSGVYGLGGSTRKKLDDFFAPQLKLFEEIRANPENSQRKQWVMFAEAFKIYSNEAPILLGALEWVEMKVGLDDFTARMVNVDNILRDAYLNGRLQHTNHDDPYKDMVEDFQSWAGDRLVKANLHVGFVRFIKYFYSLIK